MAVAESSINAHGGRRAGAGRKTADVEKSNAYILLAKARAKRETYRANLEELRFKEAARELIPVTHYERELSSVMKHIAMLLESLPDVLERDAGIDGAAVERVQAVTDDIREDLYKRLCELEPDKAE